MIILTYEIGIWKILWGSKMKKIMLVILCFVVVITSCFITKRKVSNPQKQSIDSAQQVVENYFKYLNGKDLKGINSTQVQKWKDIDKNLKHVKLDSISEDKRPSQKEAYMKYGRGTITHAKAENIKVYKVEYTVKYKKDGIGPEDSGKDIKWCTLIRKDRNSPWLIDEIGEG